MQELEKLLEEIDETIERYGKNPYIDEKATELCYGMTIVKDIIRKHMDNDGWIPVEERLPDRDGFYLVSINIPTNIDEMKVCKVWFGEKANAFSEYGKAVIAWQPLPEPYKPKKE